RVELAAERVALHVHADAHAHPERHALGCHLLHATVDEPLLHLEVGNAVAEEPADPVVALEEGHEVTRPRELLGAGHACRTGADDRHRLPGSSRGDLGRHPAVAPGVIDDVLLDVLDRDRVVVDVEDARLLAGGGADAAGELREVVRRMQPGDRLPPAAPVHEVVPVGDDVAERAALVAEGDAAIHATRALAPQHLVGCALLELAPVLEALGDGLLVNLLALVLEEAGYLTHAPCPSRSRRGVPRRCRGAASPARNGTRPGSPARGASPSPSSRRGAATRPPSACSRSGAG